MSEGASSSAETAVVMSTNVYYKVMNTPTAGQAAGGVFGCCRATTYQIGVITHSGGLPCLCKWGLHACHAAAYTTYYYDWCHDHGYRGMRFAKVRLGGHIDGDKFKVVAEALEIVETLTYEQMLKCALEPTVEELYNDFSYLVNKKLVRNMFLRLFQLGLFRAANYLMDQHMDMINEENFPISVLNTRINHNFATNVDPSALGTDKEWGDLIRQMKIEGFFFSFYTNPEDVCAALMVRIVDMCDGGQNAYNVNKNISALVTSFGLECAHFVKHVPLLKEILTRGGGRTLELMLRATTGPASSDDLYQYCSVIGTGGCRAIYNEDFNLFRACSLKGLCLAELSDDNLIGVLFCWMFDSRLPSTGDIPVARLRENDYALLNKILGLLFKEDCSISHTRHAFFRPAGRKQYSSATGTMVEETKVTAWHDGERILKLLLGNLDNIDVIATPMLKRLCEHPHTSELFGRFIGK